MRYSDYFSCCGEHWILKINSDEPIYEAIVALEKHERIKADHWFCSWKSEVKAFLKQPVIVRVT